MKKYLIVLLVIMMVILSSCATQEMIDRTFTYFNEDGKYYVEVDRLELNDDHPILTVTVKWTPTRAIHHQLSTSVYGKAGLLSVTIKRQGFFLYSSDDVQLPEEDYVIDLDINEKISRNILFSIYPFTMDDAQPYPSGSYVLTLYNRDQLVIETTIFIFIDQQDQYELSMKSTLIPFKRALM